MIKKLLTTILFSAISMYGFAQCTPDITITQPGVYPDSATGLAPGLVGVAYSQVMQVRTFYDSLATIGTVTTNFRLDYIEVVSITGFPPGISYACNPANCQYQELTNGCLLMSGTPTTAGSYPLLVDLVAYGNLTQLGNLAISQPFVVDYYVINIGTTGIAEILPNDKFAVLQNNPNPFDDKSSIYFNSTKADDISLKVFNMLGAEVFNKTIKAKKGTNTIVLDADKFLSGVYFYTLNNGVNTITKRMVVSKDK